MLNASRGFIYKGCDINLNTTLVNVKRKSSTSVLTLFNLNTTLVNVKRLSCFK